MITPLLLGAAVSQNSVRNPTADQTLVELLFNGSNGVASTVDTSPWNRPVTFSGGAVISTAVTRNGTPTLHLPTAASFVEFSGNLSRQIVFSSGFSIPSVFTFELWAYPTNPGAAFEFLLSRNITDQGQLTLQIVSGVWRFGMLNPQSNSNTINDQFPVRYNQWQHVAGVVSASTTSGFAAYVDGVRAADTNPNTHTINSPPGSTFRVGRSVNGFVGYIDNFRISTVVRYFEPLHDVTGS